jgi:hypothetical protein
MHVPYQCSTSLAINDAFMTVVPSRDMHVHPYISECMLYPTLSPSHRCDRGYLLHKLESCTRLHVIRELTKDVSFRLKSTEYSPSRVKHCGILFRNKQRVDCKSRFLIVRSLALALRGLPLPVAFGSTVHFHMPPPIHGSWLKP